MTKQQMTNVIGAGTIAAIMLILALAFGGSNNSPASANEGGGASPAGEVIVMPDSSLQAENDQLKETVQILQEREAQFTEQINIANEQLSANAGYGEGGEMEAEEMEAEEMETEEMEEEEMEEMEEEEDDD